MTWNVCGAYRDRPA